MTFVVKFAILQKQSASELSAHPVYGIQVLRHLGKTSGQGADGAGADGAGAGAAEKLEASTANVVAGGATHFVQTVLVLVM